MAKTKTTKGASEEGAATGRKDKNEVLDSSAENGNGIPVHYLTPKQIVHELDKYIIGQSDAKKAVSIALRNRLRRQRVEGALRDEIMPNNIIMIGPTGVGKTEIARRLAKLSGAPFIKVEASKFTEVGYVGRDVESMIRDLMDLSINMVRSEQSQKVQEKAQQLAEERILDILLPPVRKIPAGFKKGSSAQQQPEEDGAEGLVLTQEEMDISDRSREKMRERLRSGKMDDRTIELEISADGPGVMQIFGPFGPIEDLGGMMQDIMSGMPKKRKKRRVTIAEARVILEQEETQKLIDMDAVIKDATARVEESGIVFIDEIDKIASGGQGGGGGRGPDVSREGVQRDLLPIVEGCTVATKYGMVKTDHVLFVASGAFHVAKPSDLIPELQGRFPIRVELKSLQEGDFVKILTQPENALIKQYTALLKTENVDLEFTEDGVSEIAKIAAQVNENVENIGARRLHTIMTTLLEDLMFSIPEDVPENKVIVDSKMVQGRLSHIAKDRDLSQYIL